MSGQICFLIGFHHCLLGFVVIEPDSIGITQNSLQPFYRYLILGFFNIGLDVLGLLEVGRFLVDKFLVLGQLFVIDFLGKG